MKITKLLRNFVAVIGLLSVGVLSPAMLNTDGNTAMAANKSCAKVVAKGSSDYKYVLNVRSRPYGPVVEQLDDESSVTVVKRYKNGWVQISGPVKGYVFGSFLTGC